MTNSIFELSGNRVLVFDQGNIARDRFAAGNAISTFRIFESDGSASSSIALTNAAPAEGEWVANRVSQVELLENGGFRALYQQVDSTGATLAGTVWRDFSANGTGGQEAKNDLIGGRYSNAEAFNGVITRADGSIAFSNLSTISIFPDIGSSFADVTVNGFVRFDGNSVQSGGGAAVAAVADLGNDGIAALYFLGANLGNRLFSMVGVQIMALDGTLTEVLLPGYSPNRRGSDLAYTDAAMIQLTDGRIAVITADGYFGDPQASFKTPGIHITLLNTDGSVAVPTQVLTSFGDNLVARATSDGGFMLAFDSISDSDGNTRLEVQRFNSGLQQTDAFQKDFASAAHILLKPDGQVQDFSGPARVIYDTLDAVVDVPGARGNFEAPTLGPIAALSQLSLTNFELSAEDQGTERMPDGTVVVAYDYGNLSVVVNRYDPATETLTRLDSVPNGQSPDVARLNDGTFVVAYASNRLAGDVFAQIHRADGTVAAEGIRINGSAGPANEVQVAGTADGGFFVTWNALNSMFGRFFDAAGTARGDTITLYTTPNANADEQTDMTVLSDGRIVVRWSGRDNVGASYITQFRIFDTANQPVGDGPTRVRLETIDTLTQVAATPDGGFVFVAGSAFQRFDAQGNAVGGHVDLDFSVLGQPGVIATITDSNESARQDVLVTPEGQVFVAWQSLSPTDNNAPQVFYAVYDLAGQVLLPAVRVDEGTRGAETPELSLVGDKVLISWSDNDVNTKTVLSRLLDAAEGPVFTPVTAIGAPGTPDTLAGGAFGDVLLGDGYQAAYFGETANAVYRLYQATLDRAPDRLGQIGWSQNLDSGTQTLAQVAQGFVGSQEFLNVYGALADTGFVELLYQNVLGRPSDAGGLAGWTAQLSGGTQRAEVVIGFSESTEFVNTTRAAASGFAANANPANWSDEVFRLYQTTLDRAPDQAGFASWTSQLSEGRALSEVIAGFTDSVEFQNTYGSLVNDAFVQLLYQNVLGRAGDADGLAAWTALLGSGTARAEVVRGFSESPEFINATAEALQSWMRATADDTVTGGAGNDTLGGGRGADTFVFNLGDAGTDRLLDLEPWDTLRFTGFGYASDTDVRARMTQTGNNVTFEDRDVTIVIENTTLAQITDAMIEF
ncbi:MAG: DUF4214 domain-containing protein [Rhodobacteraceae bacterium]|nr:DUF4214 domain-containing protein [Paracoccaceae bacterium]